MLPVTLRSAARLLRRVLLGLLILVGGWLGLTPLGRYLARAAWEEGKILWRRQPIADVVADGATSEALRGRLELVLASRAYAVDSLGMDAGEAFTAYSRLDRDTLVLLLSASRRDTLAAHTWWFPVVGRFPYKGFFSFAEAKQTAESMRLRGYDTWLRPASAFSTLGWFNDPLLSTTVRADSATLAGTVFHELLHNTVFVKSQVAFNESLASFVGAQAAMRFFASRGDTVNARRAALHWEDDKLLGTFWAATARAIDSVFAIPGRDSSARIAARDTVYARMRRVLVEDIGPRVATVDTARLRTMQLDNAVLIARRTYSSDPYLFDEVHRRLDGSLVATIRQVQELTRGTDDAFAALRQWLASSGSARPVAPGGR